MAPQRHILLLEFESLPPVITAKYGAYGDVVSRFVFGADISDSSSVKIARHNVVTGGVYPALADIDGVLIPGSKYTAYDDHPWVPALLSFITQAYQSSIPLAGICYGHQIIARALGGSVVLSTEGYELGVQEIKLSPNGKALIGAETLNIHQMHRDIVVDLPPSMENLGSSASCEIQIMYQKGRVLGYQGHPEFDTFIAHHLLDHFREEHIIDEETFQDVRSKESREFDGSDMAKCMRDFLLGHDAEAQAL